MSSIGGFTGEIGRGRQRSGDASGSSSRESSTERTVANRIASPTSDDEDTRMEPIANDDTPPPPSRPLIRQALGFSSSQPDSRNINTYEAVVPEVVAKDAAKFLPGQEVAPSKPGKKGKRPKRPKVFSDQTSRFRIQTYDPTPSTDPPIDHGSGPYSSLYRKMGQESTPAFDSFPVAGPSTAPAISVPKAPSRAKPAVRPATSNRAAKEPAAPKAREPPANPPPFQPNFNSNTQRHTNYSPAPPPPSISHQTYPASNTSTLSSGYLNAPGPSTARPQQDDGGYSTPREEYARPNGPYSAPNVHQNYNSSSDTHSQSRSNVPVKLLTILIQDLRSGQVDHQLAEVKVPLRRGDDIDDGFWADAIDITRELQRGPCRIDGPARAYTLRGKYRQFLLRVSPDNKDDFMSANVIIQPDRTLDLVVELPPVFAATPAPKVPLGLSGPSYDHDGQDDNMDVDSRRGRYDAVKDTRKRPMSPSFDRYGNSNHTGRAPHSTGNKTPRHSYSHERARSPHNRSPHFQHRSMPASDDRSRSATLDLPQGLYTMSPPRSPSPALVDTRLRPVGASFTRDASMSPLSDDEDDFVQEVDLILQKDPDWPNFFKFKSGNTVADVLKEYEYVCKKWKDLQGTSIKGFNGTVQDYHIVKALRIDDPNYVQTCKKTMDLYLQYGKNGQRYESSRVMALVNDTTPAKSGSNLYKRLLHALQEVDQEYNLDNPNLFPQRENPHNDHVASGSGSGHSRLDASRGTKGMFI